MASRTRRVVWSSPAKDALDSALAYIAEDSAEAAAEVLDVVLRTGASLSQLSERGRVVQEFSDTSLREVFIYSYRLLYRVTDTEVEIVAFLHGARDSGGWRLGDP